MNIMELTFKKKMIISFALEARIAELNKRIAAFKNIISSGDDYGMNVNVALAKTELELAETIALYEEMESEGNE